MIFPVVLICFWKIERDSRYWIFSCERIKVFCSRFSNFFVINHKFAFCYVFVILLIFFWSNYAKNSKIFWRLLYDFFCLLLICPIKNFIYSSNNKLSGPQKTLLDNFIQSEYFYFAVILSKIEITQKVVGNPNVQMIYLGFW